MEKLKGCELEYDPEALSKKIFGDVAKIIQDDPSLLNDKGILVPLKFNYILARISHNTIQPYKKLLLCGNHTGPMGGYDKNKIMALYNIYKYLCYYYNQVISINGFSILTNIDKQTFYNWPNEASWENIDLRKIIMTDNEATLEDGMRGQPQAFNSYIASLNHWHNWSQPGVTRETKQVALEVNSLPELSENGTLLPGPEALND